MPGREIKYYFGRLNLIAAYDDKKEFLLKALITKKILEYGLAKWGFFDINEIENSEGIFINGYLVKYKNEFTEEVANEDTHKIQDQAIENFIVAKSRFFLHIKSGMIIYHPAGKKIQQFIFRERFAKLLEYSLDNMFIDAEIQSIEDNYKIFEEIKKFEKIKKVNIYLHPSNPSTRHIWRRTDERMKKLNAGSYSEHYEADALKGDLNIKSDKDIHSKITMADDGYGKAEVIGVMDGDSKTISTSDNPVTIMAPNDDEPANTVLERMTSKIKEIFKRFTK
jgi:hypothetical protein